MASEGLTVVFGTAAFGNYPPYDVPESVQEAFQILEAHKVKHIDTAQLYGNSEKVLGEQKAGDRFIIDTKWVGGFSGPGSTKDTIITTAKESIQKLGVKQVDIFYLHSPDAKTPISETLAAVNEIYKLGLFKRFGLSNFVVDDVQKVYDHAKENGYVLPTAYQGNYSPVARLQETLLFPTLRKLGIAFYAYSPLAGGFLTKTAAQIQEGAGRFNDAVIGGLYKDLYAKPSYINALAKWEKAAADEGVSRAELAYRWVAYNAPLTKNNGDAIIIGARNNQQLEETLAGIEKGPLSEKATKAIDDIWEEIKHEAPLDNFNRSVL